MKKVVFTAPGRIDIVDIPQPSLQNADDVILKIAQVGICGSDIHYYRTGRIGDQIVRYPFTPGHEASATVAAVGSNVRNLQVGDRVAVEPAVSCGKCDQCRAGRFHTCRNLKFLGNPGELEGALQEYLVHPAACCYKLPREIDLKNGVLLEPLTIALQAIQFAPQPGDTVVMGAGPIGLCVLAALNGKAIKVMATDLLDYRVEKAMKHGADKAIVAETRQSEALIGENFPGGVDTVFECCGQQSAVDLAIRILKPGGRLVMVGIPEIDHLELAIHSMRRKEISFFNVRRQNQQFLPAIQLLCTDQINLTHLQTHHLPIEQIQKAFELVAGYGDGVIKAMVHF